ncbi:MAG: aspartate aminotransferase family protein [Actinobacteria bacterium]|nr:aspartate aminotransferase family protein [Actinomycetota bacterium]
MGPTAFLHPFTRPAAGADTFLTIVRGEGAVVWDAEGRGYVDGMASLWYCNVGHGRAEIADAVAGQLRTLAGYHTFERFTNAPAEELCELLAAVAPFDRARVFLTSSGSEAVESAVKIARLAHAVAGDPTRTVVISRTPSYHGVTYAGMTATGLAANQEHFGALVPDMVQVPFDDLAAMARVFEANPGRVAAVLAEPVVGAPGVLPPPAGYLEGLRDLCDRHGAFLVSDEVICGFGRLGHWWGASRYGVTPDLLTFAKGVTSGYQPLGGVVVSRRVLDVLEGDPALVLRHGHTYSGHPAGAVAALVNLEITRREGLFERAGAIGARFAAGLDALQDDGSVAEVRGDHAVWAVGLTPDVAALDVREALLDLGVIARPIGTSTIAFSPPLVISDDQIDRCVESLGEAIRTVRAGAPVVGSRR